MVNLCHIGLNTKTVLPIQLQTGLMLCDEKGSITHLPMIGSIGWLESTPHACMIFSAFAVKTSTLVQV